LIDPCAMRASLLSGTLIIAIVCGCATRVVEIPPESTAKAARDALTLS